MYACRSAEQPQRGCVSIQEVLDLHVFTMQRRCRSNTNTLTSQITPFKFGPSTYEIRRTSPRATVFGRLSNAMEKVKTTRAGQTTKSGSSPNKHPMRQDILYQEDKAHDST